MDTKKDILDSIGNTPIVKLNRVAKGVPGELYAKLEYFNPGGSIKDRIGFHMIDMAEDRGDIKPGGTLVECTSGNTGMGLAMAAVTRGYKTVFVMPDKVSEEKRARLRAFGAKVVICPTEVAPDNPESYYEVGKRIARETPNAIHMNQYHNTDNRDAHYKYTGPEIMKQTGGDFDALVMGMGTCGTIAGLGRYFKEHKPDIKIVGVDPKGSILKDYFETKKMVPAHSYKVEGIGEDIIPENCDFDVIDKIVRIQDRESYLMTRQLVSNEGIFAGISSGAAVVGALRYMAETENPGKVLVIIPDSGMMYLSKAFNDAWMIENGLMDPPVTHTISDLMTLLHKKKTRVISAQCDQTVGEVVEMLRSKGISQIPVMKGEEVVGVISETDLLRPLFSQTLKTTDSIESLLEDNYTIVQLNDDISRLNKIFTKDHVALVAGEGGKGVINVLTKIDLIAYLSQLSGQEQ